MDADILPLLIEFDSQTRQIAKVRVHVVRERFASLANDAENGVDADTLHSRNCVEWCSFAECREN
jgi:hypothetical protein